MKIKDQFRVKDYIILQTNGEYNGGNKCVLNNKEYLVYTVFDMENCIGIKEKDDINFIGAEV